MKIKLNPMFEEVRGQLGDVVFRELRGKTIASRKPVSTTATTEKQVAHRERFKQAAAFGRSALADPATRELYEAAAKNNGVPVFAATIADFFNPPVIDDVDVSAYNGQAGSRILVSARDDFGIASVHVSIATDGGSPIESGNAVPADGHWVYTATQSRSGGTVNIQVVATDRPGGSTIHNLAWSL